MVLAAEGCQVVIRRLPGLSRYFCSPLNWLEMDAWVRDGCLSLPLSVCPSTFHSLPGFLSDFFYDSKLLCLCS